jgi:hypothetical protein
MQKLLFLLLTIFVSGCAVLDKLVDEKEPVFLLSPYPQNSGCNKSGCIELDTLEAKGYDAARNNRMTWINLVDTFYNKRDKIFPNARETSSNMEYRAYQRYLAGLMDTKKISESQWAYQLQKKLGELNARDQLLENSKPRTQNCVTERVGIAPFQTYRTRCY